MNTDYLWLAGKILMFTLVYYLGRLNFSFGWLMPLFYTSVQNFYSQKRQMQKAATHAVLKMDERDIIFSRLDDIPAWVLFPDFERVEWINKVIKHFWPTINYFVMNMVHDLEPVLHQQKVLRTFKFVKIDLGKITPRITGIKVYDRNQLGVSDLIVDLNICYLSDCEVAFSLNGIEGGIRDIEAEGAMRIVLKLMPFQSPFVSAIQIYFLKHPTTNFELTAALASVNIFATGELMRSILKEQISALMVYPNKIQIKLNPNAPPSAFEMPAIEGVVRLKITKVEEFENDEIYASVELGRDIEESAVATVKDGTAELSLDCYLIAYEHGVEEIQVSINAREEDFKVDRVGRTFIKMQELKERKTISDDLKLEPSGVASAEVKWLAVDGGSGSDYDRKKDHALLQVFIESARNIDAKFDPFVEITISPFVDKKQTSSTSVKNDVASWEKYLNFFIKNPQSDILTVRIFDKHSLSGLGFFSYHIKDLFVRKTMEHELQAFPLTSSSNAEIIMAMKLNILKD